MLSVRTSNFRMCSCGHESHSPVKIQSVDFFECLFNFSRISGVGALFPRSYFESWVWPIPRILANSVCLS